MASIIKNILGTANLLPEQPAKTSKYLIYSKNFYLYNLILCYLFYFFFNLFYSIFFILFLFTLLDFNLFIFNLYK